ncbi:ATP-binding protein [Streptomyces sp. bgisy154]|uniref:ATP-binding protein n=1 Tax=Streptomyces sp. bgisy154 TaxID=3413794 RepID=UPI003D739583
MNVDIAHRATPFTLQLSATRRGARLARRLAAGQLDAWGWPYGAEAHRTATLLVAELVTNAVRHGTTPGRGFRLRLVLDPAGPSLRIEVTDTRPDRRPPAPGALPPASGESGRGLLLVEALSTRWGTICDDPCTKTVWCEVALR